MTCKCGCEMEEVAERHHNNGEVRQVDECPGCGDVVIQTWSTDAYDGLPAITVWYKPIKEVT